MLFPEAVLFLLTAVPAIRREGGRFSAKAGNEKPTAKIDAKMAVSFFHVSLPGMDVPVFMYGTTMTAFHHCIIEKNEFLLTMYTLRLSSADIFTLRSAF